MICFKRPIEWDFPRCARCNERQPALVTLSKAGYCMTCDPIQQPKLYRGCFFCRAPIHNFDHFPSICSDCHGGLFNWILKNSNMTSQWANEALHQIDKQYECKETYQKVFHGDRVTTLPLYGYAVCAQTWKESIPLVAPLTFLVAEYADQTLRIQMPCLRSYDYLKSNWIGFYNGKTWEIPTLNPPLVFDITSMTHTNCRRLLCDALQSRGIHLLQVNQI